MPGHTRYESKTNMSDLYAEILKGPCSWSIHVDQIPRVICLQNMFNWLKITMIIGEHISFVYLPVIDWHISR